MASDETASSLEPSPPAVEPSLLALAGACGFAVAQPLYDLLGENTTLLVAHQLTSVDALLFAILVSFALPFALWMPVVVLGKIHGPSGSYLQASFIGLTLALLPLQASRQWPDSATGRLALLGVLGLALATAYLRWSALRRLLAWLAVGALVFPVLFLLNPAIASLGSHSEGHTAELEIPRPAPVVLVVFDELPVSSLLAPGAVIHGDRFPNFERLRRTAHWYSNGTTVAHNTAQAVPAILTGRYPHGRGKAPNRPSHPQNLFSLLAGSLNLNVVESASHICAELCSDSKPVLTRSERWGPALADASAVFAALVMAEAGPAVDSAWAGFWRQAPPSSRSQEKKHWRWFDPPPRYETFEQRISTFPRHTLHFLHLMLPHRPWQFLADGKAYRSPANGPHGLRDKRVWVGSEWQVLQGQQRHLLNLQYADMLLGRLLDTLERLGLYDESLVIVTADHGTVFRRGEYRRGMTATNMIELAHVPLMVKLPGQADAVTDDRNVQTIDIVPTIADVLGFEMPWTVDGVSLFDDGPRPDAKQIYRSSTKGGAGEPWVFSTSRTAESGQVVEQIASRFPESDLFLVAPDAESRALIGAETASRLGPAAAAQAFVRRLGDYGSVDLEGQWIPSHVTGSLKLDRPTNSRLHLAIALDGTVRAVTETFGKLPATKVHFSAMIDPRHFLAGTRHVLELFLIDNSGGNSSLQSIPVSAKY
jgi:hypothetical protein